MNLADNIWWTKKSRIQTEKRLLAQDLLSQLILLWYTVFSVFASINEIAHPSKNSVFTSLMITLSVMIMAVTFFIGNRNFKERAMLIKQCYEQLSGLIPKAINATNEDDIQALNIEYNNILSVCENHSDLDFKRALVFEHLNSDAKNREENTKHPNKFHYTVVIITYIFNALIALAFILLPIITWYFLR